LKIFLRNIISKETEIQELKSKLIQTDSDLNFFKVSQHSDDSMEYEQSFSQTKYNYVKDIISETHCNFKNADYQTHHLMTRNKNTMDTIASNKCEFCEYSTNSLRGLAIHKGKVHGCKYEDGKSKCKKIMCKVHELAYDPQNPNGLRKPLRKTFKCEMCEFSSWHKDGVSIHTGIKHRCKYRNDYGDRCPEINCKTHNQNRVYRFRN
jgi:hypothetical protein